ncbi:MAG: glycosyltransferase family 2 protein [Holophagales bacterium]|nr:glycosyltransferase family 2 protein [Holophagales bacterium]
MTPRVTVGIPLFRSAPFVDNVSANIEELPADIEILVSDRHRHDGALEDLRRRHRGDRRVRFLERLDRKDWIDHLNDLIREARGEYWRFLPHDDFCDSASFAALVDCLERYPRTLLAYGPTTAVDLHGNRLADRDAGAPHPIGNDDPWFLGLALDTFSRGHFNGAFKGLVRRKEILENRLLIRRTLGGVHAERAWLAALAVVGRFRFVPEARYRKRYHDQSTHAQWRPGPFHELSVRRQLLAYLADLLPDSSLLPPVRSYLSWTTWMRLGLVGPPVDLPPTEPFLPGHPTNAVERAFCELYRNHRSSWRAMHAVRHLEP